MMSELIHLPLTQPQHHHRHTHLVIERVERTAHGIYGQNFGRGGARSRDFDLDISSGTNIQVTLELLKSHDMVVLKSWMGYSGSE